jgi:hypothetical protein
VLELAEEALDLIALAVERLAEAGLPFAVGLGGDVGHRALAFDQVANGVAVIRLVAQHDRARLQPVEECQRSGCVVRLACCQAEPDRETLPIDDGMDLGRETASRATETMISTPLFAVAACWCARMEVLSIIWMSPS